MRRPPTTTTLLAIPGGALVGTIHGLAVSVRAFGLDAVIGPFSLTETLLPVMNAHVFVFFGFLGMALGGVAGAVVAVVLLVTWALRSPEWLSVTFASLVGSCFVAAVLFAWVPIDRQGALEAVSAFAALVGGVILLDWAGRREVLRSQRFFEGSGFCNS